MNDYYAILGVPRHASEADIKRAYRKLVVLYHPDKNRDPMADDKIKAINEAYDVLSDREKRRAYDFGYYRPTMDPTIAREPASPPHRDPAYRRRRPPVNSTGSSQSAMRELMAAYMPIVSRISQIAFIFCVVLFLDYMLPPLKSTEEIVDSYVFKGFQRSYSRSMVFVTNKDRRYKLSSYEAPVFKTGDLVSVTLTRLFHVPVFMQSTPGNRFTFYSTIYRNFIFIPLLLLITSSMGVFMKGNIDFRFNLGIMNFLVLLLTIFFLFSHKIFV